MIGVVFKLSEYKRMLPPVELKTRWRKKKSCQNHVMWLTVGDFQHHFRGPIQINHATFKHFDECVGTSSLSQQHTQILPAADN